MSADFVFLHGGGQGGWIWNETIAAMRTIAGEDGVRCLALDVPGCGARRGQDTSAMSVDAIVATLAADVAAARLNDPILVGHSQAGTLMPRLWAACPGLFRGFVAVSCIAPVDDQTGLDWHRALPEAGSALHMAHPPGSRERYRAMFCNDMAATEAEAFLDRLGHDRWPAASHAMTGWDYGMLADVRSTYILCLRDAVLPPPWQLIFAERFDVRSIVRIDAGHQVQNTRSYALAEVLLAAGG